ncbi:hypothetical protein [Streptomyces sp. H34-S4]|uniref:hypothetical protein n=1 Tax=Streptomyces sp. H34-S4 TaxID=2996463 RepID=UPI002270A698|nr:hypothetical protein [Streptomyces sp. H34-S4]MCY0933646.1 hypothetical protein [Streptomyces sp. H34-S4]
MMSLNYCTYGDHLAVATHYYDLIGGHRRYLCQSHADQYGYPEYLTPIKPDPWRPTYGYLVNALAGNGVSDLNADVWPFTESRTVEWLEAVGCKDPYLVADATWERYRTHPAEAAGLSIECTGVICLPLA